MAEAPTPAEQGGSGGPSRPRSLEPAEHRPSSLGAPGPLLTPSPSPPLTPQPGHVCHLRDQREAARPGEQSALRAELGLWSQRFPRHLFLSSEAVIPTGLAPGQGPAPGRGHPSAPGGLGASEPCTGLNPKAAHTRQEGVQAAGAAQLLNVYYKRTAAAPGQGRPLTCP